MTKTAEVRVIPKVVLENDYKEALWLILTLWCEACTTIEESVEHL